jgi:WD40 repeat protein
MIRSHWRLILIVLSTIILAVCALLVWVYLELNRAIDEMDADLPPATPCPIFQCTPNPDVQRIAFSSNRFRRGQEIYLMNSDGTCVTRLTDFPDLWPLNDAVQPSWSPNGKQILFEVHAVSASTEEAQLHMVDSTGGPTRQLTREGSNCDGRWSPDGSQIAFKSNRDGKLKLYVMNADGSDQRRLADIQIPECKSHNWLQEPDYSWSPDGKYIVFTGGHLDKGRQEIYTLNLQDGRLANLTTHLASDRFLTWLPGENKLLLESDYYVDAGTAQRWLALYVMNVDGTDLQRVVDLGQMDAPGDHVRGYYVLGLTPSPASQVVLLNSEVVVLNVECALKHPPSAGVLPEGCYSYFPEPSPDAPHLFFDGGYWSSGGPQLNFRIRDSSRTADDIVVSNYDGTGMVNLTSCSAHDIDPAWSP